MLGRMLQPAEFVVLHSGGTTADIEFFMDAISLELTLSCL